jgi:exoribonuclease-2
VEGKLMAGHEGVDIGDQIKVQLTGLNVERGFIDFSRLRNEGKPRAIRKSLRRGSER